MKPFPPDPPAFFGGGAGLCTMTNFIYYEASMAWSLKDKDSDRVARQVA